MTRQTATRTTTLPTSCALSAELTRPLVLTSAEWPQRPHTPACIPLSATRYLQQREYNYEGISGTCDYHAEVHLQLRVLLGELRELGARLWIVRRPRAACLLTSR